MTVKGDTVKTDVVWAYVADPDMDDYEAWMMDREDDDPEDDGSEALGF